MYIQLLIKPFIDNVKSYSHHKCLRHVLELDIDELVLIIIIIIIISTNKRKEAQNGDYINPLMYPR